MKTVLFLLLGLIGFSVYAADSVTVINGSQVTFTPYLPANCYDGMKHTKLNAIDNITLNETADHVLVGYRVYMVDCLYSDGVMDARYYGPLHGGRCDHTIQPYEGSAIYSKITKMGDTEPFDKIDICNVQLAFEKSKLQKNENNIFKYTYRHEAIGRYEWGIGLFYDPTQNKYVPSMSQLPTDVTGNNLDRFTGTRGVICNYDTLTNDLQGFGIEGPLAKVVGNKMVLSFYAVGLTCKQDDGRYYWMRDRLKTAQHVTVRNSANSPIDYDWNIFTRPINRNIIDNLVTYEMPLNEVLTAAEVEHIRSGKMTTVRFKVNVGNATYMGPMGYLNLIVNLDPLAVEK